MFTSEGKLQLKNAKFRRDTGPLDPNCPCYTCTTFSRSYLRHLLKAKELLFSRLATIHNLSYYAEHMRGMRQAILEGREPLPLP